MLLKLGSYLCLAFWRFGVAVFFQSDGFLTPDFILAMRGRVFGRGICGIPVVFRGWEALQVPSITFLATPRLPKQKRQTRTREATLDPPQMRAWIWAAYAHHRMLCIQHILDLEVKEEGLTIFSIHTLWSHTLQLFQEFVEHDRLQLYPTSLRFCFQK